MGQWSSGYDVALTTRSSPVQFRLGPFSSLKELSCKIKIFFIDLITISIEGYMLFLSPFSLHSS